MSTCNTFRTKLDFPTIVLPFNLENSGEVEFGAEGIASTQRVPLYLYTDGEITSNYWISDSDFQYWNYEVYGITSTGEEIYIFSEQNWH